MPTRNVFARPWLLLLATVLTGALSACSKQDPEPPAGIDAVAPNGNASAMADTRPYETAGVSMTSIKQGWVATGLGLNPGDAVTIAGEGNTDLGLGNPLEPRHLLWARIGDSGAIFQLASNIHTFTSQESGELYITASPPALVWANRQGERVAAWSEMPDVPLAISVTAYKWRGSASDGLQLMAADATGSNVAQQALTNIEETRSLPAGFEYLWFLNASNVFDAFQDDTHRGVHASTSDDVGIIRKPLDIALTPDTRIDFDWLYETLPALGPETEAASHDYISIALEFDNGHDITWFWSAHLPEGEMFPCPLPDWQHRETHIVLQSGEQGLGEWHSHSRGVQADYQASVGGEMPKRIVAVWVIANALFGRQPAEAYLANARISNGELSEPLFD